MCILVHVAAKKKVNVAITAIGKKSEVIMQ